MQRPAGEELLRCAAGYNRGDPVARRVGILSGGFQAQNSFGELQPGPAELEVLIRSQHVVLRSFRRVITLDQAK